MKGNKLVIEIPDGVYFGNGLEGMIEIEFENYKPSTPFVNSEDCGDSAEWDDMEIFLVINEKNKEKRINLPDGLFLYYREQATEIADQKFHDIYEGQYQSYLDSVDEKE